MADQLEIVQENKRIELTANVRYIFEGIHDAVYAEMLGMGADPEDRDLALFNAPRPLFGATAYNGEFVAGVFYGLVRLDRQGAAWQVNQNVSLDARVLVWVTEDEVREWAIGYYAATYAEVDVDWDNVKLSDLVYSWIANHPETIVIEAAI